VYRTEVYKGRKVTTHKVRWTVGGRLWKEGFRTAAQPDSFRSAADRGSSRRSIELSSANSMDHRHRLSFASGMGPG
jgi:hypothetical protein